MTELDIGFLGVEVNQVRISGSDIISNSLCWFADYGYRPEKTLWTLLTLLLLNIGLNLVILYWQQDAIVPALEEVYLQDDKDPWTEKPREYPSFNPLIFALDTLIRGVVLGQEKV